MAPQCTWEDGSFAMVILGMWMGAWMFQLTFCDHMKRPQRKDQRKLGLSRSQSGFKITWQSNFLILGTALLHHPHFDCVSGQKKQLPELWVCAEPCDTAQC